jgi:hypothetical protein
MNGRNKAIVEPVGVPIICLPDVDDISFAHFALHEDHRRDESRMSLVEGHLRKRVGKLRATKHSAAPELTMAS